MEYYGEEVYLEAFHERHDLGDSLQHLLWVSALTTRVRLMSKRMVRWLPREERHEVSLQVRGSYLHETAPFLPPIH